MNQPKVPIDLSPREVASLLARQDIVLVDVREPAEFAALHIAGAVPHPLSSFDPAKLPAGRVVLMCGVGKRSAMAVQLCQQAERPVCEHLAGGTQAWVHGGLPVVR
jgi:rhodanese-related sulfurtransferase